MTNGGSCVIHFLVSACSRTLSPEGASILNALKNACAIVFLTVFAAVSAAGPAFAHQQSWDVVDNGEIRYVDQTGWDDARIHAVGVWNDVGSIEILPDEWFTTSDLIFMDYAASDNRCGVMFSGGNLQLNNTYFQINTVGKNRSCAAHEMGHALGLDHSYPDQLMDECPVCSNPNYYAYPQSHDRADYHERWG